VDFIMQADHSTPIVGDRSNIEPALHKLQLGQNLMVLQCDDKFHLMSAKLLVEKSS
jgi:hypothetical protein